MILRLAYRSLLARSLTVGLTVCAVALSVTLFLGVEKIRTGARNSFTDTISGTDLIVGARSGSVQLLLYSIFRIGNATNNLTWKSYLDIADRSEVEWIVPVSLGDSHRQFRVMGTTPEFFLRYRYREGQSLRFAQGGTLDDLFDTVIGADVAAALGYAVGTSIVVSHGIESFVDHADRPFQVTGILEKTGTPVDRTVIVSMEALEAIHIDWEGGAKSPGQGRSPEEIRQMELLPKAVTAALVGVESPLQVFRLMRWINEYPEEPLLAILPGVALQELWQIVGVAEFALVGVSFMVVATALTGMMVMTLSGLNERRREMAIWRAMGAHPRVILGLLTLESALISGLGVLLGTMFLYLGLWTLRPWVDTRFGIWLPVSWPTSWEFLILFSVVVAAILASLVPGIRAYRISLADGMMVRY